MDIEVGAIVIDVNDLARMKEFWTATLGYRPDYERDDWVKLVSPSGAGVNVSLQLVPEPRDGKNRLHLDLYTHDRDVEVERIRALGATLEREAGPDDDFVVLGDPEGNLFCVIQNEATS